MNDNVHSLIGPYAVDALDAQDRALVERHLLVCTECREDLAAYSDVTAALADAEATAPPASLRARVLEEVARTPQLTPATDAASTDPIAVAQRFGADGAGGASQAVAGAGGDSGAEATAGGAGASDELAARRRSGPRRWLPAIAGAAATVAIGVAIAVGVTGDRDDATSELALEKDVMMVTSAPDAHAMDLDLGNGHLVMSERMDGLAVMGAAAPMPKDGMEYQVWLIMDDGKAMPGPTFMPHDDGEYMAMVHTDFVDVAGVAITEEPMGGSEQPTSTPMHTIDL